MPRVIARFNDDLVRGPKSEASSEGVAGWDIENNTCLVLGHRVGIAEEGELGGEGEDRKSEVSVPAENSSSEDVSVSSLLVEDEKASMALVLA